ncbi:hypothetical protein [Nocardiopsis sp. JB363]|uniref:hypothetical protein n=1 Tax=Nocardiopsis sp. JB363 TaxID=1434837 RepID=UPI00097A4035|nr:hypothetical protein [Nocardiopsis sp. JB363]SIO86961.1 hypothetical protein BQ8420_14475 [Nocardiopsis sp. JB363]
MDRALAAKLIARTYVLGAHNHLHMAVGARGVIAAYGKRTYVEDVIEHTDELADLLQDAAEIELGLLSLGQA